MEDSRGTDHRPDVADSGEVEGPGNPTWKRGKKVNYEYTDSEGSNDGMLEIETTVPPKVSGASVFPSFRAYRHSDVILLGLPPIDPVATVDARMKSGGLDIPAAIGRAEKRLEVLTEVVIGQRAVS